MSVSVICVSGAENKWLNHCGISSPSANYFFPVTVTLLFCFTQNVKCLFYALFPLSLKSINNLFLVTSNINSKFLYIKNSRRNYKGMEIDFSIISIAAGIRILFEFYFRHRRPHCFDLLNSG